jgi:NAD(P)-dependent dehydrogenase (short-subunit alcohol dehydrogenase family)
LNLTGKTIVVTGGGNGIGRALCQRFAREGVNAIVVADLNGDAAAQVAHEVGGTPARADVAREDDVAGLVASTIQRHGDEQTPIADWERCWNVNVMAHVHAARAVVPHMLARGGGYLLQTVSAAGLLTHIQSATYAVTKHAALAFAEWLSVAYGDRGLKVSALCPQGVRTDMLRRAAAGGRTFLLDTALEPEQVADEVVRGLADERFLILPHPEVAEYVRRKAADYDRWLKGMRKLRKENV